RSTGGHVVLVEGEAGSGKTHLVSDLAKRVEHDSPDLLVLSGKCSKDVRVPFSPFRSALDALIESMPEMPAQQRPRIHRSLVLAARTDSADSEIGAHPEIESLLDELGPITATTIRLPPLELDALRVMLSSQLGGHLLDERTIRHIADRSSGNPQLAGEYLRA